MNPLVIGIMFLVLFAIILIAVSLGIRVLEVQRKKQVEGMLNIVSGEIGSNEPTILMNRTREDPLEAVFSKVGLSAGIEKIIQQSGLAWTVSGLVAATLMGTGLGAVIGFVLRPLGFLAMSVIGLAVVFGALPYLYLRRSRKKRMAAFESQLPEALDFLARSMRAGHAFSISLEMLGQESPDPMGQEFRVLFNEQNLGAPLDVALRNFSDRVPLLDVRLFVSSVLLQKQTGGNLSEILIRLAYVIRERFRLKGQVKAASAHGRMTAGVLSALPACLIVALLFVAPGYLQGMAADPDGKWMIAGAILAQCLGYYVMRRIVDIKV